MTACDPSCATCAGPTGICLTCQPSLQPLSTSATKCTTATAAQKNGTFITCPSRTFFDPTSSTCVACNPLCEDCFSGDATGCLACRAPNALLGGVCGAFDGKTGVCDPKGKSGGWVLDNVKGECDGESFSPSFDRLVLTSVFCSAPCEVHCRIDRQLQSGVDKRAVDLLCLSRWDVSFQRCLSRDLPSWDDDVSRSQDLHR